MIILIIKIFALIFSLPVAVIASSILVQCHSISEHGQLSFMNQHQTHRLCARIHTAIELPLADALLKQQQPAATAGSLDEVKLIKLKVHLEAAVRLVREQVGVRSLSGLLLYQTQAKEFQVINANLAAVVNKAGLSSYVNNEKENVEDEKENRVLLAQLVEAEKGLFSFFLFLFIFIIILEHSFHFRCPAYDDLQPLHDQRDEAAAGR